MLFAGLVMAALQLGAVLLYDEGTVQAFSEARAQAPAFFAALGVHGSATLTQHLSSLLYGFLLPLIGLMQAAALGSRLVADKVETGELSHYLALPLRRPAFGLMQAGLLMLGLLLPVILAAAAGIMAGGLLRPGQLNDRWFLWLNLGLFLALSLFGGLCFLVSALRDERRPASRQGLTLGLLLVLISMAARIREVPAFVSYLTPLSLYDPAGLAQGKLYPLSLLLPLLSLLLVLAGLRGFSRRELAL